ncbi:MAG: hypothetical protein V3T49_04305 [Dehalococcoidia bacterium]
MHLSISSRSSFSNYAILAAVIFFVLSACATSNEPDYVEVKERTLHSGDEIPATSGTTIVSFSGGSIGDGEIAVDIQILESIGTVKYSVDDPYENRLIEYEGVLLRSLFDQFADSESASVTITAIDDYQQVIPRVDAEKWPIILAIKSDGEYTTRDHRGPSMIIYPYDQFSELEQAIYDPFWVWQIAHISFD